MSFPPGLSFLRVARCLAAPGPVTAVCTPSRGLEITGRRQGFTRVRPSSLPLACGSSMAEASLGLNAQLHTPPLPATHVSAGTGLGHWPEVQPIDTSSTWLSLLTWSDLVSHLSTSAGQLCAVVGRVGAHPAVDVFDRAFHCATSRCRCAPEWGDYQPRRRSRCVLLRGPMLCGCSVKDGEQALDAAAERGADAVDAVEVGAAHGAVAHHDEVPGGVFWFAATR